MRILQPLDLLNKSAVHQLQLPGQLLALDAQRRLVIDELVHELQLPLYLPLILDPLQCQLRRQIFGMLLTLRPTAAFVLFQ